MTMTPATDDPDLTNSHWPNAQRFIRPDVKFKQVRPGGPTRVYLNDEEVLYPIVRDSINVQRRGSINILTLSIIVGEVDMDTAVDLRTSPAP